MIEAGYESRDVREFSLPKLVLVHADMQRRRLRAEQCALWIAAAGASGGNAFKKLNDEFAHQLQRLGKDDAESEPERGTESDMPLSLEDLKRQLAED